MRVCLREREEKRFTRDFCQIANSNGVCIDMAICKCVLIRKGAAVPHYVLGYFTRGNSPLPRGWRVSAEFRKLSSPDTSSFPHSSSSPTLGSMSLYRAHSSCSLLLLLGGIFLKNLSDVAFLKITFQLQHFLRL